MKKSALLCSVVLISAAALALANEAMKPGPVQQLDLTPAPIQSDDSVVEPVAAGASSPDATAELFAAPATPTEAATSRDARDQDSESSPALPFSG